MRGLVAVVVRQQILGSRVDIGRQATDGSLWPRLQLGESLTKNVFRVLAWRLTPQPSQQPWVFAVESLGHALHVLRIDRRIGRRIGLFGVWRHPSPLTIVGKDT